MGNYKLIAFPRLENWKIQKWWEKEFRAVQDHADLLGWDAARISKQFRLLHTLKQEKLSRIGFNG